MKSLILTMFAILMGATLMAQQASYTDPVIAYQRILLEKSGQGSYRKIGTFKVIGSPYFWGGEVRGDIFTAKEKGVDVFVDYDTYYQQLEVHNSKQSEKMNMSLKDVDSFFLYIRDETGNKKQFFFINATFLDKGKKMFIQELFKGEKCSLYKGYKSTLGYVSTNYVESELRQFDLETEYFYYSQATSGKLKKLKLSDKALIAEFKDIRDITDLVKSGDLEKNPETTLLTIFAAINQ
ncbi:MAG TPA: hypothetical protein PKK69_04235 [Ferruginibacter sp.]|nr:hypothetical protein [Ferruginibacter sp.]